MKLNGGRRINWMSWDRLCRHKNFGGLGFKDLHIFNLALLAKQCWNMLFNPTSLMSRLLKDRYFSRRDFLHANLGLNPSFIWCSIWSVKYILELGCRWRVHSGEDVKV